MPSLDWIFVWIMFAVGVAVGHNWHKRKLEEEIETYEKLSFEEYYELLFAVEKKHPGETRHETALRYIQERENQECRVAQSND